MKKSLLFLFAILFCAFPFINSNYAMAENDYKNSIELIKISSSSQNEFAYLFPVNSKKLKEIIDDSILIEGFKFYLKSNVNVLRNSYNEKAKDIEGMAVSDVKYYSDYDAIGFEISFSTLEAYYNFFGENSTSNDTNKKSSGLFWKRKEYEINFPFSVKSADAFRKMYSNLIATWGATFEVNEENLEELINIFNETTFTYELISASGQIHSENSFEVNGVHYNIFEKSYEELEKDSTIEFYTISVNAGWWYFFALLFTLLATIIIFLVIKFKKSFPQISKFSTNQIN